MALRIDYSAAPVIRHVYARSRGRHCLYPDGRARATAARQLAEVCLRHGLSCIVWCMTDRCLHVIARGRAAPLALATEEFAGKRCCPRFAEAIAGARSTGPIRAHRTVADFAPRRPGSIRRRSMNCSGRATNAARNASGVSWTAARGAAPPTWQASRKAR